MRGGLSFALKHTAVGFCVSSVQAQSDLRRTTCGVVPPGAGGVDYALHYTHTCAHVKALFVVAAVAQNYLGVVLLGVKRLTLR